MSSIIAGYNYDIFISYRQKDNKHDGWVTEFVNNLKGELEAAFKEDISVYFDENPHDRLQETHNVNKSLEGKLKSLIFIPILSQTFCDPNSYAWQNEFLAFTKIAGQDHFGIDVKLRSGNVASRILPIRIHDLDPEDIKLFEKETGGVLRAIDFVFRTSAGVNRPLRVNEDHPNDNLNKTFYRDQVNKVANAIKEIIQGMKAQPVEMEKESSQQKESDSEENGVKTVRNFEKPSLMPKHKYLTGVLITSLVIIIATFFIIPKIFSKNKVVRDQDGKISIAVNNLTDNSGDTTMNNLKIGIADILRNDLARSGELLVQNSQTMYELYQSMAQNQKASMVPSLSREAAIKLKAGAFVTGSFQKIGDTILILLELNDTRSSEVLWSDKIKGRKDQYPYLTILLSESLKNFLEIKALKQKASPESGEAFTKSSDAYRKYIDGIKSSMDMDFKSALSYFLEAYKIDSTFVMAAFYVAYANDALAVFTGESKYRYAEVPWIKKAYKEKDKLPETYRLWLEMWYAYAISKNINDVIKYCELLERSDVKSRIFWMDLSDTYMILERYNKAQKTFEKIDQISADWKEDWKYQHFYSQYGNCCHILELHGKEAEIFSRGLKLFPEDNDLIYQQIVCALATRDTIKAEESIKQRIKNLKEIGWTSARIENSLGSLYRNAKSFDKAEEHYRLSMQLDSNYDWPDYNMALMFIDNNIKVEEGMSLLKKLALKYPKNLDYTFYFNKAKGLFLQGRYSAADSILKNLKDTCISVNPTLDKLIAQVKESLGHQK